MSDIDGSLVPAGTAISPRHNLKVAERCVSILAGSVMGLLAARQRGTSGFLIGALGSALVLRGISGVSPTKRMLGRNPGELQVAEETGWSSAALLSRSVTINATREDVYRRFRDVERWADWAVNVDRVDVVSNKRLHLMTADPSGTVQWDCEITDENDGSLLAFASVADSAVPVTLRFEFRDAPSGRGTEIHGVIAYQPPGGRLGRLAAKLTEREPGIQLRRDLKRFKSLIETGEIAINDPQSTKPKA